MEFDTYLRFVLALLLVLGLIAILAWVLRRFGFGGVARANSRRRLQVLESTAIGPRHRLVLVRRDDTEHLLLLGPQGDVVVERGIPHHDFQAEMARGRPTTPRENPGLDRQDPPLLHPTAPARGESAT